MRDFAKQLTTFRSGGPGLGAKLGALVKFGVIFAQQLAQAYLRRGARSVSPRKAKRLSGRGAARHASRPDAPTCSASSPAAR